MLAPRKEPDMSLIAPNLQPQNKFSLPTSYIEPEPTLLEIGQPPILPPLVNPELLAINNDYEENCETVFSKPLPPPPSVLGCTNEQATNYNPDATVDDGSCILPISGCTNTQATNYNPLATVDDGSCIYPGVSGCTDPLASNYNPNATIDDGSCVFTLLQYTPTSGTGPMFVATTSSNNINAHHGVDGTSWLNWTGSEWDGTQPNRNTMTKAQLCNWVSPSGSPYQIRGLREHYNTIRPFADERNPTIAEINEWTVETIRHIRNLFGITTPVIHDARLYLECRWADERKNTTQWDATYPDTFTCGSGTETCLDAAPGPCSPVFTLANSHCGDSFFPNQSDRNSYITSPPYNGNFTRYPELSGYNSRMSQAVGISGSNLNLPWSVRPGVAIMRWICAEGLTGHSGPYIGGTGSLGGRTNFGCSWYYNGAGTNGKDQITFRGKWR
jgi:hypothetical protein